MHSSPIDTITTLVCAHFGVTVEEINGKSRTNRVIEARHTLFYLLYKVAGMNYSAIEVAFGKSHGVANHAYKVTKNSMDVYPAFAASISMLESKCRKALENL